jgi:2-polyprenyl-6-methoxyphenol hydroxylase-like FAD-dependent oxidoreductase
MTPPCGEQTETWDLIIVGAGPAGAATALGALAQVPGLRVLLLDRTLTLQRRATVSMPGPQ